MLNRIHHISIICSDYERSKAFYTNILGLQIIRETLRPERHSYKLDLSLDGRYVLELFSFPNPPARMSRPEATGLRHLAFRVDALDLALNHLKSRGILSEPVRIDEYTGKKFSFIFDPDQLPIELYEDMGLPE